MRLLATALLAAIVLATSACGGSSTSLPVADEKVALDPAEFTSKIDNQYWPMAPGTIWTYRETDADGNEQHITVTVTGEIKEVMGIEARVVHDLVTEDGETVEDTYDWYAQDADGSVWYLGEDTKEYENGKVVSREGSWEAGVDGAQPGIAVPAEPEVGVEYRQEYYAGKAEDAAVALGLHERAQTPLGSYEGVLMTKDFTPLDPEVLEYKFYAPGVGPVVALGVSGEIGREELIALKRP